MVTTRISTSTIAPKNYSGLGLHFNQCKPEKKAENSKSQKTIGNGVRKATKTKHLKDTKTKTKSTRPKAPDHVQKIYPKFNENHTSFTREDVDRKRIDFTEGDPDMSFPSRAWGEGEEVGTSLVTAADRDIAIWENVLQHHQNHAARLVPVVEKSLQRAREHRAMFSEDTEWVRRVGAVDPEKEVIETRLATLTWARERVYFLPEVQNIMAAIAGYKNGEIKYSAKYTLIYAGKVVDTAETYEEFTINRQERLDRYCEKYGDGWLWWEPPLKIHPDSQNQLQASVGLAREDRTRRTGLWYINQGFWKRDGYVRRMKYLEKKALPTEVNFTRNANGEVYCQSEGPKINLRTLLDSGATLTTIQKSDLEKLGIDPFTYGAQSVGTFHSPNGTTRSKIYELFVCVLDENGRQLVDEKNAMYPNAPKYLGGLSPVAVSEIEPHTDANGFAISTRLSGIQAFLSSYISYTPTKNTIWFGEDRNDVLGYDKMPGQRRWDLGTTLENKPRDVATNFDRPLVKFSHGDGKIVDLDFSETRFASCLWVDGKEGVRGFVSDPGLRMGDGDVRRMEEEVSRKKEDDEI